MRLLSLRIAGLPPFDDLTLPFADEMGPRSMSVLFGGAGVGKTTLLHALASTRPGCAVALQPATDEAPPFAVCDWALGCDDPDRPHPLRVATPMARLDDDEHKETFRRREQALFEKLARKGGFAFLSLPSIRWFSRQPFSISAPARTVARYEVRAPAALDDASRADLTRETKQALAYAAISYALAERSRLPDVGLGRLEEAMNAAVGTLVGIAGFRYIGIDPIAFEPHFEDTEGSRFVFDRLPTRARHLVAFAALSTRTLWAAYPGRDPRESEGVVAIDDVDLHQDANTQAALPGALRRALPGVQWILTTTSPTVAMSCDEREVCALRRAPELGTIELYTGAQARLH